MSDWPQISEHFLQLVFPPRCPFCDALLPIGAACEKCAQTISSLKLTGDDRTAVDRKTGNLEGVISSFFYQGEVSEIVARYKFRGEPELFRAMAQYMADDIAFLAANIDVVTFVPSFRNTAVHARRLAKGVAKIIGKPFKQLIYKTRKTQKQHDLNGEQRNQNIKGAFATRNVDEISGKNLLICDDVVTTGNTLNECAAALKLAGAKAVYGCTFSATESIAGSVNCRPVESASPDIHTAQRKRRHRGEHGRSD